MNKISYTLLLAFFMITACNQTQKKQPNEEFRWQIDRFADIKIMRYQVPGWDSLSLHQKELIYDLSQAALCGRDIIFDQNYKYNLAIRRTLESIYENYRGERSGADWDNFMVYLKRVWFSNGIHHHYSMDKFLPQFSKEYFLQLVADCPDNTLPLQVNQSKDEFLGWISDIIFNPEIAPKRVCLDASKDLVTSSACNFYEGVTQKEVEEFYNSFKIPDPQRPLSLGLNSKVVKKKGKIVEIPYVADGLYGPAIQKII